MQRLTIRFFLIPLACLVCAPAVFAQTGKLVTGGMEAFGRAAAAESIVKSGVRSLPGAAARAATYSGAKAVQLELRFPGDPVQLEIPFPAEQSAASASRLPVRVPAAPDIRVNAGLTQALEEQAVRRAALTLPSGERARLVKLEAKHFKKTNKLNSTIGHYASVEKNPVVLVGVNSGEKVTVFKNDRLRFFSDVNAVCPAGSYLLRYENGKRGFVTPEQASESLVNAYEAAYKKLHGDDDLLISAFAFEDTPRRLPQVSSLSLLFTKQSFGTKVYTLESHPLNQQLVQVAVLERGISVPGLPDLNPGAMVVLYRDGTFDVHLADRVPPVLKEKVDAEWAKQNSPRPISLDENGRLVSKPVVTTVRTYDNQTQLARDVHASGVQGKRYKDIFSGEAIAYEIPAGIYYQPAGRAGKLLDPSQQVIMYYPAKNDGQLVAREALAEGWFTPAE